MSDGSNRSNSGSIENIIVKSASLPSSNRIHDIYYTFFEPAKPIKATLLILHGMSEHSGRYIEFAKYLADQGIAVLTYDHLGHGKSVNKPEELGYFNEKDPMPMLLKDVVQMSDLIKSKYKDSSNQVPHYIMGHSMGSFILRNFLKHHVTSVDGAILMGTGDKDPLIRVILPVVKFLNNRAPYKRPEWIANTMSRVLNLKARVHSKSIVAWISACEENLQNYEDDPLCGFSFTNNGYYTLFQLMDGAINDRWYKSFEKDFPLLITSGKNDPVGNMGKGINKLVSRLQDYGLTRVDKKLYDNMRHEPLNEKDKQLVYKDIAEWILLQ